MKKVAYRLKKRCGEHVEDGHTYVAGDKVVSTRNLVEIFKGKFEKIHRDDISAEDTPNIPSSATVLDKGKGEGDKKSPSSKLKNSKMFGRNVSLSFPAAIAAELRVYEKDAWYQVVDWNTEDEKPEVVSKRKLREKDVASFLETFVESDDDDEDDDEDE